RIQVNLNDLTYTLTPVFWGLVGDATGSWDVDQDMTYDAEEGAWTLTTDLTGGGKIKFRANDGWDINLGDNGGDALLEYGGGDIPIPNNGTYEVKLYLGKPDYTYSVVSVVDDFRKFFYTNGQTLEINDLTQFTEGYAVTKFKNVKRDGSAGKNGNFPDTDFPVFRLADAYLMFAEGVLRGGTGGTMGEALGYVNDLRTRAGAPTLAENELTLDFMLDERCRELYWECHRRTDLVRFGQFSDGNYVWEWKGGVLEGQAVSSNYDVFPIPASDIGANPNLTQNAGY
ncbi:MAG: RagB/SusD family nutrient uptake outer membrane protein, partial [Lewinella sp.]|nr:RagB/SusD family nutrient uptake outer membrane protein [Lewinella sp.]